MNNNGIEINDLYGFGFTKDGRASQRPNNVHFLEKGSEVLAAHITKLLLEQF